MGTIVEEIFSQKLGRTVKAGEIVIADIDHMMTHDNTTPLAILSFKKVGKPIKDPSKIIIVFDHAYPAPNLKAAENHRNIIDFMKEEGIENFFHKGVCHQVMFEEGFVKPGQIILGGDSHTNTYGAFGALGLGFGSTELGMVWMTGKTWFKVPETILVRLSGKTRQGVSAKDVMLKVIGKLTMDGATYKSLEFEGDYIKDLPMHERIIFSNMSTEAGAKCGLIASDETTIDFLKKETKAKGPFEIIKAVNPEYERILEIDVTTFGPQIACPHNVDNVKPLSEVDGLPMNQVFIGTCTNGRYEDLKVAADILKGRHVDKFTKVIVTPASVVIMEKAMDTGLIKIFHDSGCTVTVPGCGACIGRRGGVLSAGEKALTTMNRNFLGRMGSPESEIYLGSPAVAAATAIAGKITDPEKFMEGA